MKKQPVILLNAAFDTYNNRECNILIGQYAERVAAVGGIPLILPVIENRELIVNSLTAADGVLLIGGKDYPAEFFGETTHPAADITRKRPRYDLWLSQYLLQDSTLPVLGICAGCQMLAIADGGKLCQHLPNADEYHRGGKFHSAAICADGWLSRSLGVAPGRDFTVNSFHHQAVLGKSLQQLQVTACAADGTVEAIELPDKHRMVMGVQFHPERMDDLAPAIFGAFIANAATYRSSHRD